MPSCHATSVWRAFSIWRIRVLKRFYCEVNTVSLTDTCGAWERTGGFGIDEGRPHCQLAEPSRRR